MFVIPTVISTIADIISIIDMALKYGGFLSKDVKNVFEKSRDEIANSPKSLSIDEAKEILSKQIRAGVTQENSIVITKSISSYLEIIDGTIKHIEEFNKQERIVEYGNIYGHLILRIGEKLDKWGCFEKWAENLEFLVPYPATSTIKMYNFALPAPKLSKVFWKDNNLRNLVSKNLRTYVLSFWKTRTLNTSNFANSTTGAGGIIITNKKYYDRETFKELAYVQINSLGHNLSLYDSEKHHYNDIKLSNSEFVNLISGALGDFFDYTVRVNNEYVTSNTIISQLKNQKNAG